VPELPEVETVRRGLLRHLLGRRLVRVEVREPRLRRPVPAELAPALAGRRLERVERRGKYLLLTFAGKRVLLLHLGMSGRLLLDRPEPFSRHEHLRFGFEGGRRLSFIDPRRFGIVDLLAEAELERDPRLRALGPEPLAEGFDGTLLWCRLQGRRLGLKAALLDQTILAGLGNIYACEALYHARLHPLRPAGSLSRQGCRRLAAAIRHTLEAALAAGGSSLRDFVAADGMLGLFQHRFAVYGREGEPCGRCGRAIQRLREGGRSTFYCPKCQRRRGHWTGGRGRCL